jgi:Fic family protein
MATDTNTIQQSTEMLSPTYEVPFLPLPNSIETPAVLRASAQAHRHLAELKGRAVSVPNPTILLDTLTLQEARASCEVENIVTTQDWLYRADLFPDSAVDPAAKEVARYRTAVKRGFDWLRSENSRLTNDLLIELYQLVTSRADGFRTEPGTVIGNAYTGEIVYVPPQHPTEVAARMTELERFINDNEMSSLDPLVKMAVIHHQFESIHPFEDGNGRVGRILNVLYLVRSGLLESPILYLSGFITRSKADYYQALQRVRDEGDWEGWLLYMLQAVSETARRTLVIVERIRELMAEYKHAIRSKLPRIYSHELVNNIFRNPYTKIDFVRREVRVSRPTAARYLEALTEEGLLSKRSAGRGNYYVNTRLVDLFSEADRNTDWR